MAGHIFQARSVWIYIQSDITNIIIVINNVIRSVNFTSRRRLKIGFECSSEGEKSYDANGLSVSEIAQCISLVNNVPNRLYYR